MSISGGGKPMDSRQQITDRITTFFAREITSNARNSYHSWEHCYNFFATRPTNFDLASLHLGFYLASWGMYRGSAAIRNFDHLIHRPAAEELLKPDMTPCEARHWTSLCHDLTHYFGRSSKTSGNKVFTPSLSP